jgi:hypothetical protein
MADYLEVIGFVDGRDNKKRAVRCGRAKVNPNGEVSVWLDAVPTHPSWDGSFKCAIPRERDGGGAPQGQSRQPSFGGGGGRQSAPQSSGGGSADFGPGAGDADDLPF